jgi:dihydrofolate reductase
MRKLIAAINISIDGYCDHTVGIPDKAIHKHYADLLNQSGAVLYGRIAYQMMEYWRPFVKNPTGEKLTDDFVSAIDRIPKIVFSHTLKNLDWESARLAKQDLEKEVLELKEQDGKDILVCSPSLIAALTKLKLIDEYQLCIHPVIAGNGLALFKGLSEKMTLNLIKTKSFDFGAILHYYEPKK